MEDYITHVEEAFLKVAVAVASDTLLDEDGATGFFEVVDINSSDVFRNTFVKLFSYRGFPHHIGE
jgi:hypothetical protein